MESQINTQNGICFYRVDQAANAVAFLHRALGDAAPVAEWLNYGSVYADGVRLREDVTLNEGQVLRVHTRRKSYVTPDLRDRIVFDHADFLVLDKPAGLPTHPTLDNYLENAKVLLETQLGLPIHVTHRLDIPTAGLLILAKTKEAQSRINKLFLKGYVEKTYRALTTGAVPEGRHVHFIDPETKVPRAIQLEEAAGWWRCELEVLASHQGRAFYVNQIRLLTGKTHQIRAQLSALGEPILGDTVYGGDPGLPGGPAIGLECAALSFRYMNQSYTIVRPRSVAEEFLCP